jgi:hypothetical protein
MTPEADHHLLYRQGPLQLKDSHPRQVVPGLESDRLDEHEEGLPKATCQLSNQVRPLALKRSHHDAIIGAVQYAQALGGHRHKSA